MLRVVIPPYAREHVETGDATILTSVLWSNHSENSGIYLDEGLGHGYSHPSPLQYLGRVLPSSSEPDFLACSHVQPA